MRHLCQSSLLECPEDTEIRQKEYQRNWSRQYLHFLESACIFETVYHILMCHLSPYFKWDLRWLPLTGLSVPSSLTPQIYLNLSIERTVGYSPEISYRHHRSVKDRVQEHKQEDEHLMSQHKVTGQDANKVWAQALQSLWTGCLNTCRIGIYEGCFENKASYFIMLAYNIGSFWYGRRSWTHSLIFC